MSLAEAKARARTEEIARAKRLTQIQAGRVAREIMGITQAEAAVALGVDRATFRTWEYGTSHPSPAHWRLYKLWLVEMLVGYASIDNTPVAPEIERIGSSVFRQRLGLLGHCHRCLESGDHRITHPRLMCRDVGCHQRHDAVTTEPETP